MADQPKPSLRELIAGVPKPSPLLCPESEKEEREASNGLAQLEYIEDLVARGIYDVRVSHVLDLQRLAVSGIYPCAGNFRTARHDIELQNSPHVPPSAALVPSLVNDALTRLAMDREARVPAMVRAAYALWRFNWIHPFAGGNGRTARAIAYLIICLDHGAMLPGHPTMTTLIAGRRTEYQASLRDADQGEQEGAERLERMRLLVISAMVDQLRAALEANAL